MYVHCNPLLPIQCDTYTFLTDSHRAWNSCYDIQFPLLSFVPILWPRVDRGAMVDVYQFPMKKHRWLWSWMPWYHQKSILGVRVEWWGVSLCFEKKWKQCPTTMMLQLFWLLWLCGYCLCVAFFCTNPSSYEKKQQKNINTLQQLDTTLGKDNNLKCNETHTNTNQKQKTYAVSVTDKKLV